MNHTSEMPAPPATRVVSVGTLKELESTVDFDGFSDDTLAEVQLLASRITDSGAEVLVSIVVENETNQATGQAEVPLEWFGQQVRMRNLINAPADLAAIMNTALVSPAPAKTPNSATARRLAAMGLYLHDEWCSRRKATDMLRVATVSWIGLVEHHNADALCAAIEEFRMRAFSWKLTRPICQQIGEACKKTSLSLIQALDAPK